MLRMYNTVGAPGRILSTGFNSKETTYLLFVYEQAYLPYLKKSLMKSTIVRRNTWEINTSFYRLSSCSNAYWFVPSKTFSCEVMSTSTEKLSSPCHNQWFDTVSTN